MYLWKFFGDFATSEFLYSHPNHTASASLPQRNERMVRADSHHPSPLLALPPVLAAFESTTLAEMQAVALLDRVETKYALSYRVLLALLANLSPHYRVLTVAGERLSRYQTLYYDTTDFALYHSHHAGLLDRYKVRTRHYVDSDLTFLEVKQKTNKKRIVKERIPITHPQPDLTVANNRALTDFIYHHTPYAASTLQPVLYNQYRRITLVGKQTLERITLDLDVCFCWQDKQQTLHELVIAEVKQAGRGGTSPFTQQLRQAHIQASGFSKYCMGLTLLYPSIKANRFKAKQRQINKLLQTDVWPAKDALCRTATSF